MHRLFAMACCLLTHTGSAAGGKLRTAPCAPRRDLSAVPSTADVQSSRRVRSPRSARL